MIPAALEPPARAPDFSLVGDDGKTYTLAYFAGRTLILYFYPKDSTPGCTQQACDFRDHLPGLTRSGAVVVGVSPDSVASHQRFKQKFSLPFLLLADPGATVAAQYGAYGEKNMYGKKMQGILRTTFVISPHGDLVQIHRRVSVKGHVDKLAQSLNTLS